MSKAKDFLTAAEEAEVVQAISQAEKNTSGEIRVHIEKQASKQPLERAKEVFNFLGMDNTAARNGVLFYVGVADKSFAIIGDEGIDKAVENDFWNSTKDIVISHFKEKKFKDGLIAGISMAGEKLRHYFPFESGDKNELSNEISRG
ncbi:MAG TPA: TPM domain-containing protein [Flavobacterium sp.]|nr:TPM domain-containing protein [Flavobacterium sp.]